MKDRPLLQNANPYENFIALYKKRKPVYQSADIHVRIDDENLSEALAQLISQLEFFAKTSR